MNQQLHFSILESLESFIFACDKAGELVYLNKRARDQYGSELVGQSYTAIASMAGGLYREDGQHKLSFEDFPLSRALRGESVKDEIISIAPPGMSRIYLHIQANPLYDSAGIIFGAMCAFEDVTDYYSTTQKLQRRFKIIFDQAPISIQIFNKEGQTVYLNPAFRQLWGFSESTTRDILKSYNILEDNFLQQIGQTEYIKRAFAGETMELPPILYDPTMINLEGRTRHAGGLAYPLKDAEGNVEEVVLFHFDVTAQTEANFERDTVLGQLALERNKLETILNQLPTGVLVIEASGKILLQNEIFSQIFHTPRKDIFSEYEIHRCFTEQGEEYTIESWPLMRSLKLGEVVKDEIMRVEFSSGQSIIARLSSAPIYDSEGRIAAAAVIGSDITHKQRIEEANQFLARVKTILMSTLDHDQVIGKIASACVPYFADGCFIDLIEGESLNRILVNHKDPEKAAKIHELTKRFPAGLNSNRPSSKAIVTGEPILLNLNDTNVFSRYSDNSEHAQMVREIAWHSSISAPLRIRGKIIGSINFFNEAGRPELDEFDLNISMEIARRAATAIDNARLYRDLQKSIRLRDDFISVASHELKTPITTLNLQLEVLADTILAQETGQSPHALAAVSSTKRQLERLSRLVEDMLDISRIESGKLSFEARNVNLCSLLNEVAGRFENQLKKLQIELTLQMIGQPVIYCDPYRLEQVITNLLTNAVKYGNRQPIKISLEEKAGMAILQVKDHGRGIPKVHQERIFGRFERAVDSDEVIGLGLGLYISRRILQEMNSQIRVESEENLGSNFIVEIPLVCTACAEQK